MDPYQPPPQFSSSQNINPASSQNLQARSPPINNYANIPLQDQYQQQQQAQIPLVHQNNQQSSAPPSQYAHLRANSLILSSRKLLRKKILDIEINLERRGFYLYKLWLDLMTFVCGFMIGYASVAFVLSLIYKNSYAITYNYYAFMAVISAIWVIQQCLSMGRAIEKKDLVEAKKALNSMYLFAVFSMIFGVGIFVYIQKNSYSYHNWFRRNYKALLLGFVIPMPIQIFGARKVKKLLEKRDAFAFELHILYANNL